MNMRYKAIITGIMFSIFLYSITHTDWIERVKLLFVEKYAKDEHPAIKHRAALVYAIKNKIEKHLTYGKTLEQTLTKDKKEQKQPNQEQHLLLLLWKLYAKALVTIVDKKSTETTKNISTLSTTFLSQVLTKLQIKKLPKEPENSSILAVADIAVERLFAQLFAQHLIELLQNYTKNLSQNTFQEITASLLLLFKTITDLAPRYLPLKEEAQLALFDTLYRLIPHKQYNILAEGTASFINAANTLLQQTASTDPTLSRSVLIQNNLAIMRPFITSTLELSKKQSTAMLTAYQNTEQILITIINNTLVKREHEKENLGKIYENLVTLISYTPYKQQTEWSKKMQGFFVTILRPFTALCQDTKLTESFIPTLDLVGSTQSTAIITASNAGKKLTPSIRVLLHTIRAATHRCEKNAEYKAKLDALQTSLYISAKEHQKQEIMHALEELCTIRTQSITERITKTFSPTLKSFVQFFAIDAVDIDQFLNTIKTQKQTQNQLSNILKTKGKLYQQKLAIFYQEYLKKFFHFVTTKYHTIQKLHFALTAEAQKQYKTTDQNITNQAIRSWILSYPLLYDILRKKIRNAAIFGNITEILQSLIAEFDTVLPFLRSKPKKP